MLIATINYNTPEMVDSLAKEIKNTTIEHELMVLDNGSTTDLPKSTTHRLDANYYFGGAVRVIHDYFLNSTHDVLVILNSDLLFHGISFFDQSLREMKDGGFDLYSPSIINTDYNQLHWRQMWNWGTGTVRNVKWIDYQCPFYTKELAKKIVNYPETLFAYGLDFYGSIVAHTNGMKIGVSDTNTIAHLNSKTLRTTDVNLQEYCSLADKTLYEYFMKSEYKDLYTNFRDYGQSYQA
jgi:GT2 family glycosyltransferase